MCCYHTLRMDEAPSHMLPEALRPIAAQTGQDTVEVDLKIAWLETAHDRQESGASGGRATSCGPALLSSQNNRSQPPTLSALSTSLAYLSPSAAVGGESAPVPIEISSPPRVDAAAALHCTPTYHPRPRAQPASVVGPRTDGARRGVRVWTLRVRGLAPALRFLSFYSYLSVCESIDRSIDRSFCLSTYIPTYLPMHVTQSPNSPPQTQGRVVLLRHYAGGQGTSHSQFMGVCV